MAFPSPHTPAQAKALLEGRGKVDIYDNTGGKVTRDFAAHNLTIIPQIPSASVIHDNGAANGTVSRLILNGPSPPSDIKIHATDIDQVFLDALSEDTNKNNWPIEISNQPAQKLSFADNTFTHSFTNMTIFLTPNGGLDAAKEIHRTLKPGGVAVVNCWETITWLFAFKKVHDALRPGAPYPAPPIMWNDGKQLQKVLSEAGFSSEHMRVERSNAVMRTRDLASWAEQSWAFLGGMGGWRTSDSERWKEAVDLLQEELLKQPGIEEVDGEVRMMASQWIVIATK